MKCDLLYKAVFSHQNSLESFAVLKTYYRANTVKLLRVDVDEVKNFVSFIPVERTHRILMLSTVSTLPAELYMHCKCPLASSPSRVHCVLQEKKKKKKNTVFTSKKFSSALFFINFSFLLLFAFQTHSTFACFILRFQSFLIDLFTMFGFGRFLLLTLLAVLGISVCSAIAAYFLKLSNMAFLEEEVGNSSPC